MRGALTPAVAPVTAIYYHLVCIYYHLILNLLQIYYLTLVLSQTQFWLPELHQLEFRVISESRHCRLRLTSSSSVY